MDNTFDADLIIDIATDVALDAFVGHLPNADLFTTDASAVAVGNHIAKVAPSDETDLTEIKDGNAQGRGDSNLVSVSVPVKHYEKGGFITPTEQLQGFKVEDILKQKFNSLAKGLNGLITAVMTPANFPDNGMIVATPADMDKQDITDLSGAVEAESKVLLLKSNYYTKLVPTNADALALVDGAYGYEKGVKKISKFKTPSVVGFTGAKSAIVLSTGLPVTSMVAGRTSTTMMLPNNIECLFIVWGDVNTGNIHFSYQILAGAEVAIAKEGGVITNA